MKLKYFISTLIVLFAYTATIVAQTQNTLSFPDITGLGGKAVTIPFYLNNDSDVTALQFTMTLPEGCTLSPSTAQLTERSNEHTIIIKETGEQQYMCMAFSQKNLAFKANSGKLFTVELYISTSLIEDEEYEFNISDAVLTTADGNNVLTNIGTGKLYIMKSCDIAVGNITADKNSYVPEEQITVSWNVENIGETASSAGWKENVFLVGSNGYEKLLGSIYYDDILESKAIVSRQATFTIPSITGIDGETKVKVQLQPYSNNGERTEYQSNNTKTTDATFDLGKTIYFNIPTNQIDEGTNTPIRCTLARSGNRDKNETFTINTEGNDGRLSIPSTIDITTGNSESVFYITVNDNDIIDRNNTAILSFTGNGYQNIISEITVVDNEYPTLSLSASSVEIEEGNSITLTITSDITPESDVNIKINSEANSRFTFPTQVTIPQNENSVTFVVNAINDATADVSKDITFTATAQYYNAGETTVILHDNDVPQLELEIYSTNVSESSGINSITGILRRLSNTEQDITIELYDNSKGEIYYPYKSVEMKSGVESVEISLGIIDNSIVDGNRNVEISAAVYIASCGCNASVTSVGVATKEIQILDNDGAALSVSATNSTCKEGSTTNITVSRNTTTDAELSVTLSCNNDSALQYEQNIVIPAGATSVNIPIAIEKNDISEDSQIIVLTAKASQHTDGTCWIMVTDQTLPDAQITSVTLSETTVLMGETVGVNVEITNNGTATLKAPAKVEIISRDSEEVLCTLYTQNDIAVGESESLSNYITLPNTLGKYDILAVVNKEQSIKELQYANNTSATISINLLPLFSATVTTDKTIYMPGDSIVFSGKATGQSVSKSEVEVYIINSGIRQTVKTKTDLQGNFSIKWLPYSQQFGHFIAGACYPGETTTAQQCTFDIYGLKRTSNNYITCETLVGEIFTGEIMLSNPSNLELTSVKAEILSKPENCDVTLTLTNKISGNETVALKYELLGNDISSGTDWEIIKIRISTAEGVSMETVLYYFCRSPKGQLKADITQINTTMLKNATRDYPFTITNIGKGETGKITFALPSWITTVTPNIINTLAPEETSTVILRFNPKEEMSLNVPVKGQIGINCSNGNGIPLQYEITPVSEATGRLIIDVCDEYTYYTKEAPHVSGAEIIVKQPTTGAVISQGKTGDDGIYNIELPEGYYNISVTADNHDSYNNNILLDPGKDNNITVNLSFKAVSVNWDVEETEVEDEYEIVSTVKYETNVPVPVLEVVLPDELPEEIMTAGTCIINAVITNKGLITAQDVNVSMEEADEWQYEILGANNIDIQPSTSIVVPIKITINQPSYSRAVGMNKIQIETKWFRCYIKSFVIGYWDCGNDRKWHRYEKTLKFPVCESTDKKEPTKVTIGDTYFLKPIELPIEPPIGPGPNNEPESIKIDSIFNPGDGVYIRKDTGCEPCQNKFLLDLLKCIPPIGIAVGFIEDASDCFTAIDENERISEMLRECPFTSLIDLMPSEVLGMIDVTQDFAVFAASMSNKNATIEEKAEAFEKLQNSAFDLIDDFYDMPNFNKLYEEGKQVVEQFDKTIDDFSQAVSDAKNGDYTELHKQSHALLDKGKNVLEEINELGEKFYKEEDKLPKGLKVVKRLGKYLCIVDLLAPCDNEPGTEAASLIKGSSYSPQGISKIRKATTSNGTISNSAIEEYQHMLRMIVNASDAQDNIRIEILGDEIWGDVEILEFLPLYFYLTTSDNIVYNEATDILRPQNISKEDYIKLLDRWNDCFNKGNYQNIIDIDYIKQQIDIINVSASYLRNSGYTSYAELFNAKSEEILEHLTEENNSVCASISLKFSQTMVMTRQAFRGTLTVFNGNETTAMENIRLNIELRNEEGVLATSREFQINAESLDNFTGETNLDSAWSLAANETGTATVLFIPTKYAAPTENQKYSFGGTLTYIDPFTGNEVTRDLFPVELTVKPSPNLNMTYFMQRDIYGDDPLTTDIVESIKPAEFSLLIHNIGYGDANNIRMTTKQPQIIENEKGLAVNFEITGSQLNGKDYNLALGGDIPNNFGTIPAQSTLFAQWSLEATLLGHFTNYDIEANHVTSYGNENLTLLNEVTIHELIKSVGHTNDNNENLTGFIVNDIIDSNDMPDMIYLSDGSIEKVRITQNIEWEKISETEYLLTIAPDSAGWNYGYVKDPTLGRQNIKSITRNDGVNIDLHNIWQTDRVLRDGKEPLYENRINIADKIETSGVTYTVTFEPQPEVRLDVESFDNIPTEDSVSTTAIDEVYVKFNKNIDATTFTTDDINITIQGISKEKEDIVIEQIDGSTFAIDISSLSSTNGLYVLTIYTDEIIDEEGYNGKYVKNASWIQVIDNKLDVTVTVSPQNGGTVTVTPEEYEYNSNISLTAYPNEGYTFNGWSINDEIVSNEKKYNMTLVKDIEINAVFAPRFYNITIAETNENEGKITGTGSGIYNYNEELVLSVNTAKNHCLEGWYLNGEKVSSENVYRHIVNGEATIEAKFAKLITSFVIYDNTNEFVADEDYTYDELSYIRNFENTDWQALYIPFTLKYEEWADDFEIAKIKTIHEYDDSKDGITDRINVEVEVLSSGTTEPNYPYFIKANSIGTHTFTPNNTIVYETKEQTIATVTSNLKYEFKGAYSELSQNNSSSTEYYVLKNSQLTNLKDTDISIVAFRWYLKITSLNEDTNIPNFTIDIADNNTTGIDEIVYSDNEIAIYSLDGRLVKKQQNSTLNEMLKKLERGIYIINGQKLYKR